MFSVKQFILNMSAEARKELRELLDYIESNLVEQNVAPVEEVKDLKDPQTNTDEPKA